MKMKSYIATAINHPAVWSLGDQAAMSGGNFILSLLLARELGLEQFGLFTLWYMVPLVVLSISQAIIVQPFQAFWPGKNPAQQEEYSSALWNMQLLFVALVLVLSFIGGLVMQSFMPVLAILLAGGQSTYDLLRKLSYATGRDRLPVKLSAPLYFTIVLALILGVVSSVQAAFLLLAVLFLLAVIVSAYQLGLTLRLVPKEKLVEHIKKHYHFSYWLLGAAVVQWFSGNAFLLAAAALLGNSTLGALRLAQQVVGVTHVVFLAMENRVPIAAAQHFQKGAIAGLFRYLIRIVSTYGVLILILFIGLLWSEPLLALAYSADVVEQVMRYVPVYTGFYVLVFLATILRIALRSAQLTASIFWSYCLAALLSACLAYPLVEHYGWVGVLLGLVLTQLLPIGIYIQRLYAAHQLLQTSKSLS